MIGLLTIGILLIFQRFVRRPLRNIADKMALVEAGDLSARLEPVHADEVGQLMRSFNSMVDKLSQAQAELQSCHYQQMERADRLASVGEMSAGIAHEIKNPLAAISGAISVLASDFPDDDPRREVVAKVLEQITRLDKAATDLLYFGKPGKPSFTWVDTNALLKKTLFFVAQHPEARNVHQVQELTRNLPPVWVDEKQLQQVFFNVIINAIQAMKDGGTLLIQTDLEVPGRQAGCPGGDRRLRSRHLPRRPGAGFPPLLHHQNPGDRPRSGDLPPAHGAAGWGNPGGQPPRRGDAGYHRAAGEGAL